MANSRRYTHFIAAMEQRTLLGASVVANLSQPALSKSIIALEEEYGVDLFDRHPRGLTPTVYGYALEHHARRILLDIEQSKSDIAAIAAGAVGRLRVGVGQAFVEYVEGALIELENKFPGVNNLVITDYAEGLRHALLENRVDIVLGMVNRLAEEEEFETTIMGTDQILGVCHQSHEFAWQEVSLDQLRGKDWIVPERGEVVRSALEAYFLLNQVQQPRFKIVTNIPTLVGQYVKNFNLLSLSPETGFSTYRNFDLAWFKIKGFEFKRQIGIVQRAGIAPNPLTTEFKNILQRALIKGFNGQNSENR